MAAATKLQTAGVLATKLKGVFSSGSLAEAVAGVIAGTAAVTLFSLAKNATAQHGRAEGWALLLKGQIICLTASNIIFFYSFQSFKALNAALTNGAPLSSTRSLALASLAGITNVLATSPLHMIFTKMMVARKRRKRQDTTAATKHGRQRNAPPGMLELGREIVSSEGVGALWSGVAPSLGLVSNIFLQFLLFKRLKGVLASVAKRRNRGIAQLELFAASTLARAAATLATYPLQIVQSILRSGGEGGGEKGRKYDGTVDCLAKLQSKKGIARGWYEGLNARLLQTVFMASFHYLTYETIRRATARSFTFRSGVVVQGCQDDGCGDAACGGESACGGGDSGGCGESACGGGDSGSCGDQSCLVEEGGSADRQSCCSAEGNAQQHTHDHHQHESNGATPTGHDATCICEAAPTVDDGRGDAACGGESVCGGGDSGSCGDQSCLMGSCGDGGSAGRPSGCGADCGGDSNHCARDGESCHGLGHGGTAPAVREHHGGDPYQGHDEGGSDLPTPRTRTHPLPHPHPQPQPHGTAPTDTSTVEDTSIVAGTDFDFDTPEGGCCPGCGGGGGGSGGDAGDVGFAGDVDVYEGASRDAVNSASDPRRGDGDDGEADRPKRRNKKYGRTP